MLRPGFEPESSARKAEMIGRTTLSEQIRTKKIGHQFLFKMGPGPRIEPESQDPQS